MAGTRGPQWGRDTATGQPGEHGFRATLPCRMGGSPGISAPFTPGKRRLEGLGGRRRAAPAAASAVPKEWAKILPLLWRKVISWGLEGLAQKCHGQGFAVT